MQKRWYSSGVLVSRITILSPRSIRWCRSSASISGTWLTTSTFSPKSLLGTLLPHSVGKPRVAQRLVPASSTDTRSYPKLSRVAAASLALRPSSSQTTIWELLNGTASAIWDSSIRRGMELESGMWELLYSPASRTSINANWVSPLQQRVKRFFRQMLCHCWSYLRSVGYGLPFSRLRSTIRGRAGSATPRRRRCGCYLDGAGAGVRASSGSDCSQLGISTRDVGSRNRMQAAPPRLVNMEMYQATL